MDSKLLTHSNTHSTNPDARPPYHLHPCSDLITVESLRKATLHDGRQTCSNAWTAAQGFPCAIQLTNFITLLTTICSCSAAALGMAELALFFLAVKNQLLVSQLISMVLDDGAEKVQEFSLVFGQTIGCHMSCCYPPRLQGSTLD